MQTQISELQQAIAYYQRKDFAAANNIYYHILKNDLSNYDAHHLLGLSLIASNKLMPALFHLTAAKQLQPKKPEFYNSLGSLYSTLNYKIIAKNYFDLAISINPFFVPALFNKAQILYEELNFIPAIDLYQAIIQVEPKNILAQNNLAIIYIQQGSLTKAKTILEHILTIDPNNIYSLTNLGNINLELGNYELAGKYLQQAITLNPNFIQAQLNYAQYLKSIKDYTSATKVLENLYNQSLPTFLHYKVLTSLYICYLYTLQWNKAYKLQTNINTAIASDLLIKYPWVIDPFEALLLNTDKKYYNKIVAIFLNKYSNYNYKQIIYSKNNNKKINIGYISSDFNDHPIGLLFDGLFALHNRKQFTVSGFATKIINCQILDNIKSQFDTFIDLSSMSDLKAAQKISELNIDILIDLAGFSSDSRTGILYLHPAKIQCHWAGYPYSLSNKLIDYFITNDSLVDATDKQFFTEKLIKLESCWLATTQSYLPKTLPRCLKQDYDLPEDKIVFCNMHQAYRIQPELLQAWSQILINVPDSVLWLQDYGDTINNIILDFFSTNSKRIIFSPPERLTHKYKHQLADLWLDSFNFSGGTSTFLSLSIGLPVITLKGSSPENKVAATILNNYGVSELITTSVNDYIALATNLGNNSLQLRQLKQKILDLKAQSPIFNPKKLILELENKFNTLIKVNTNANAS